MFVLAILRLDLRIQVKKVANNCEPHCDASFFIRPIE